MSKILIVDDVESVRTLIAVVLQGHETMQARDGAEALFLYQTHKPDLVICDLVMPEMNGYQFEERARQYDPLAKILFISGYADKHVPEGGVLLTKPFTPKQLRDAVEQMLSGRMTARSFPVRWFLPAEV